MFLLEFRALDYSAPNLRKCDLFCLTLRHLCFLHQLSFTRLCRRCAQYAHDKCKADGQDSTFCHLHEPFDPCRSERFTLDLGFVRFALLAQAKFFELRSQNRIHREDATASEWRKQPKFPDKIIAGG